MTDILLPFITGLTTGGLSCLAIQGGLLTTTIENQNETDSKKVVGVFVAAKIIAYTLLGAFLGLVGKSFTFSVALQGWMQIAAGLFMLVTAARILDLHPAFRYIAITPPKFLLRLLRKTSHDGKLFTPAILGTLTVLIPCGVTQAMMVLAVASGNVVSGALTMFAFTFGTTPVFATIGITALSLLNKKSFTYLAAATITIFGLISVNTGQVLRGSPHTLTNYYKALTNNAPANGQGKIAGVNNLGVQEVDVDVSNFGYTTSASILKVGIPVRLKLKTQNVTSCSRAFTIPALNISKNLPQTGEETIEFTPKKVGLLAFSCSMGMYTGEFTIVQ